MPSLQAEQSRLVAISLVVLAAIALAAALAATRTVMIPFVLAIFISYLVLPLIDLLQYKLKFPRPLAVVLSLLAALGLLTLLGLLITSSTRELLGSVDIYRDRLAGAAERALSILDFFGVDLGQQPLLEGIRQLPMLSVVRSTAGTVVDVVKTGVLVLIFVIYLVVGRRPEQKVGGVYAEIHEKIQRYIVAKFAISATTGLLVGFVLSLFGLDLALMFGVMAFLLNFIPSIGSIVATLLPIPIAIIQFESTWTIVGVVAIPGAIQMIIGNGIEPLVLGHRLDLHPVTILLALIFWGLLWGIVGMFLAVPITAVIQIVLSRIETTRPFAELLAGRLPRLGDKSEQHAVV
jgi:AI-2 transport protein TqsA